MSDMSDEDNIVKSKVIKRIKEKKLKSILKKKVQFKINNAISGNDLRNDQKRCFRKKKAKDKISIQLSSNNSQISFMSRKSNNSKGYFESESSNDSSGHYEESDYYNRKIINKL